MLQDNLDHIYEIINTIQKAVEYINITANKELQNEVRAGRSVITEMLEQELQVSLEEQINISSINDTDWIYSVKNIIKEAISPFRPQNVYDLIFYNIIKDIWKHSEDELLQTLKTNYLKLNDINTGECKRFVEYLREFPMWGTFDPEKDDWNTFKTRVSVIKQHSYDLLWLYRRLEDYDSKRVLTAIVLNWKDLAIRELDTVVSKYDDYFEPDIFPNSFNEVFVDAGAFTGDTIASYLHCYGAGYKKIYAYEISPESCDAIRKKASQAGWHDVVVCQKGVAAEKGEMFLAKHEKESSANKLGNTGEERVELVSIDEDAPDATFIKMDIEGAEKGALMGCKNLIKEKHPKMAICTYHGYEDLWKIPALINSMYPDYHIYMRHYGGNMLPTEFVLYCKP